MTIFTAPRLLVAVLALGLVIFSYPNCSFAQTAADQDLQNRMRIMQERLDALSAELESMKKANAGTAASAATAANTAAPASAASPASNATPAKMASKEAAPEPKLDKFLKGFYGTLNVSLDDTTKGIDQTSAFHWSYVNPLDPKSGLVRGDNKGGAVGRVGWLGALSSNGSNIGYRGSHKIANSSVDFIYQVSTAIDLAAAPGLTDTWTKSSNTVTGAIGLGDTFIGFKTKNMGTVKIGTMYAPYKTSTDRLNPFNGELGGYNTVISNTGGDNRVEFGTRLDHTLLYNSPNMGGFSFDLAYALGQNVTFNSVTTPLGSPDCAGGNIPGSGNLPLNCDDGGFNNAYSADIKFETGGLYLTAAWELHTSVNRNSDGIGSNSPYYNFLLLTNSPLLDFATWNAWAAENPGAAAQGSPPYLTDIASEWAMKVGGQYRFGFGLTVDALWEEMKRDVPAGLEFQNERQRMGLWFALEQDLNHGADQIAAGWAHAGATVGDPAGEHDYNALAAANHDNQGNSYSLSWKHRLDKQLTWYIDAAETINDGNAHFDIGAGGHGIKTDCHDGTNTVFTDFSSAGPTTWGGCHEIGFSTGVNYKF